MDIIMLRSDYQKFLKHAQSLLKPQFFLQNYDTENDYFLSHAKLRDSNTTFIESYWKDFQWNHGIFIDIFPLDFVPDHFWHRMFIRFKRKFYQNAICVWGNINWRKKSGWKNKLRWIFSLYINRAYKSRADIVSHFDSMLATLPLSKKVAVYEDPYEYEASYFSSSVELPFENTTIALPIHYHEYLTITYGDYMTPPTTKEQQPVHTTTITDTNAPYSQYR